LFAPGDSNLRLSKIVYFNRFLSLTLIINLLFYTFQINYKENLVTNLLVLFCWFSIFIYAVINETSRQIIKKSIIATPEVCHILTQINSILTALLISIVSFCTGNTEFMLLFLIPIFSSMFTSNAKFSAGLFLAGAILLVIAEITGWLKFDFLIVNRNIYIPISFTYMSIIGLLCYLGYVFSGYIKQSSEKQNMLFNQATTDALTGLINRREFNKRIIEEISRAKRHKSSLTLALFDIDYFKKINDTYGHSTGDKLLKELAELVISRTRECDIVARYGGEEFALILPETNQNEAYELLERLRMMIECHNFCSSLYPIKATISVGLAEFAVNDDSPEELFERADKALYRAKRSGRNCVECAPFVLPKIDLSKVLVNT